MITLPEILRLHLRDEQLGKDVDLHSIASKTDYYSGSDLKGQSLSSMPTISYLVSSSLRVGRNGIRQRIHRQLQLGSAYTTDTADQVASDAQSEFPTRTLRMNNFAHAINEVPPSSTAGSHSELLRWHGEFSRKRALDRSHSTGTNSKRSRQQRFQHIERQI